MCRLIGDALAGEALEVVAAGNAFEALRVLDQRREEPLLVLIDVLMPGMDGLSLARRLTSNLRQAKIVIMSGHLSDASWWPADLREVSFITKPFHLDRLTEYIREARLRLAGAT